MRRSFTFTPAMPSMAEPTRLSARFQPIIAALRGRTDAVLNITTGGSPFMFVEERILPAAHFKPELASLNMGSFNFGLYPMLQRFHDFRFSWERQSLEDSRDLIFRNTFQDIEYVLTTLSKQGTKFEFECYDVGHLYNLAHFLDRRLVQPPLFVQTIFGILGGNRKPPGRCRNNATHCGPSLRRRLLLVGAWHGEKPDGGGEGSR